jgi:hypothetical protein
MKIKFLAFLLISILIYSCSDNLSEITDYNNADSNLITSLQTEKTKKESAKKKFASLLSKAVCNDIEIRSFIKNEAIKQFDKDYDVFYPIVKNKVVKNGKTFREMLLSYCDKKEELEQIEDCIPLLNIYVPDLSLFEDINVYNWDVKDEVPVAFSNEDEGSILFLNGDSIMKLEKDEIPGFHLLLIKENERVASQEITTRSTNAAMAGYEFVNQVFDGTLSDEKLIKTRSTDLTILEDDYLSNDRLDPVVLRGWEEMKTNPVLQRDYIYYGMTLNQKEGLLKTSIDEYLYRFQIDPAAYFKIADQKGTGDKIDDPMIKDESTSQKKSELSNEEVIRRLWTEGNFEIKFRVYTGVKNSTALNPSEFVFNVEPKELFDIKIQMSKRHKTAFRHSQYTYRINPKDLGRKWYYPREHGYNSRFDKWDISQQSLEKFIYVYEIDESETLKTTETVVSTFAQNFKSSLDGSTNVGSKDSGGNIKIGLGYDTSNSKQTTSTIEITTNKGDDFLGTLKVFFYDPIIIQESKEKKYRLKDINNGTVTITIMPITDVYTRSILLNPNVN